MSRKKGDPEQDVHPEYAAIGATLRRAREAKKWSQDEVGRRLGITGAAVSLIEKGKSKPTLPDLREHGRVVGVRISLLVAEPEDKLMQLAARFVDAIDAADPAVLEPLSAWVAMWEAKKEAVGQRA
jgi:transcriptional regulator with XRE-family HTH domain